MQRFPDPRKLSKSYIEQREAERTGRDKDRWSKMQKEFRSNLERDIRAEIERHERASDEKERRQEISASMKENEPGGSSGSGARRAPKVGIKRPFAPNSTRTTPSYQSCRSSPFEVG